MPTAILDPLLPAVPVFFPDSNHNHPSGLSVKNKDLFFNFNTLASR
jgi:hypothetical protein